VSRRVLALDTTGESGSIALVEDGRLLEERPLSSPDGFAHILFGEIESLLAKHGLGLRDIDVFASASGPGSFTGVRVGLAAVKGLAEATGRKVIAISNLQALAWYGTKPLRATVIDARRGEIFGAVYSNALEPVCPEVVIRLDAWLAALPAGDVEFITTRTVIPGLPAATQAPGSLAAAIGAIASLCFDRARDPAEIDANYVRRSDAELMWKE
jgi:tRNA threonylcarbamoyladenosine biosynthesis protein TsaB